MRRNLTLEETGVLDLRKFIDTDEGMKLWFYSETVIIPVNWLVAHGFFQTEANWDDEAPGSWLVEKFPTCISTWTSEITFEPVPVPANSSGSRLYSGTYESISIVGISANGLVLHCEEL